MLTCVIVQELVQRCWAGWTFQKITIRKNLPASRKRLKRLRQTAMFWWWLGLVVPILVPRQLLISWILPLSTCRARKSARRHRSSMQETRFLPLTWRTSWTTWPTRISLSTSFPSLGQLQNQLLPFVSSRKPWFRNTVWRKPTNGSTRPPIRFVARSK